MELLLEDYKRKQKAIREMIETDDVTEATLNRLKIKQGMINSFIVDIHAAMARSSHENSGLHIADVKQRVLKWWERLPDNMNGDVSKYQYAYRHYERHWMSLTYREIERIYGIEHVA